jgi:hypothetical protein
MYSRIEQSNEINGQIRALSAGLDGHREGLEGELRQIRAGLAALRERFDAELRLVHRRIIDVEQKVVSVEARLDQLERRSTLPPETMYAIELATRL